MCNIIKASEKCPKCKKSLEWQSKELTFDGLLIVNGLMDISLKNGMEGETHALCDGCGGFIDAKIANGKIREIIYAESN